MSSTQIERSDEKRGHLTHIQDAIAAMQSIRAGAPRCVRCRKAPGTHMIDVRRTPRVVCAACAGRWAGLRPEARQRESLASGRR